MVVAWVAAAERWEPLFSPRSSIGGWNCWKIASCCLVTRSSRHRPQRRSSKTDPSFFCGQRERDERGVRRNRCGDGIVLDRHIDGTLTYKSTTGLTFINGTKNGGKSG